MTRLLLITLLVLSSGPAYAEWVAIDSSDVRGGFTTYADPDTVRRKGNLVKMWTLRDFKTRQNNGGSSYLSTKALDEYDCTEEQYRKLAFYMYPGQMGASETDYMSTDPGKWTPVVPNSVGETMWKVACDKK